MSSGATFNNKIRKNISQFLILAVIYIPGQLEILDCLFGKEKPGDARFFGAKTQTPLEKTGMPSL